MPRRGKSSGSGLTFDTLIAEMNHFLVIPSFLLRGCKSSRVKGDGGIIFLSAIQLLFLSIKISKRNLLYEDGHGCISVFSAVKNYPACSQ